MLVIGRFSHIAVPANAISNLRAAPVRSRTFSRFSGGSLKEAPCELLYSRVVRRRYSPEMPKVFSSKNGQPELEAVVVDLKGISENLKTLWLRAISKAILELYGVVIKDDVLSDFANPDNNLLSKIASMQQFDQFDVKAVVDMTKTIYLSLMETADSNRTGLQQLIKMCMDADIRILVPSVFPDQGANSIQFSGSSASSCSSIEEFATDVFIGLSRKDNVLSEECLVITDTSVGAKNAKQIGARCLAVSSFETESELVDAGAHEVVENFVLITKQHLIDAFLQLPSDDASASPIQQWLRKPIYLPGNMKTDRRSFLQTLNLGLASTCVYLLFSRSQAISYANPRSLLRLFNPFDGDKLPASASESRTDAFLRYIGDVEQRGGGEEAPEFPSGVDWFNSAPLTLRRNLKGKMVILDFWTYCCINCMHVLPDLQYIEKKFGGQPVAVVGVHSAKFDNEKDSDAIRNAVIRYNVDHPVINDGNMIMWKKLGVSSWPTLIVLSPKGRVLFTLTGEGHRYDVDNIISAGLQYYGERDLLNSAVLPLAPEKLKDSRILASNLKYPGKLASDIQGNRLFISDSNNHRIVITTLSGQFLEQIGGNGPKLIDGNYDTCAFNHPQGVCYDSRRDCLFVADTDNHAMRKVDLQRSVVKTVAGNGYQGRDYKGGNKGQLQQLSSPWDVEIDPSGQNVFIAMAGQHQIWKYDNDRQVVNAFSGNGYESNRNGNNALSTSWAQPSGLSLRPIKQSIIVADSESSSIRELDLETAGSRGIAGGDPFFAENLFRFGDEDGSLPKALFQHPLGVLATDTDTTSTITTVCGSGQAGYADGSMTSSRLSEPSGLAMGPEGTLFIADTNNNLIRILDLTTSHISTLQLTDVPQPRVSPLDIDDSLMSEAPAKVMVSEKASTQNGDINLTVNFQRGFDFTKGAISTFRATVISNNMTGIDVKPQTGILQTQQTPNIQIHYTSVRTDVKGAQIQIDCKIYYCKEREECLLEDVRFLVPLADTLTSGNSQINLALSPGDQQ